MTDCIFCNIVAGDIPAKTLYEDEHALALLDAFPLVEGHTLVIPKSHFQHLQDMPSATAQAWFAAVHRVFWTVAPATEIAILCLPDALPTEELPEALTVGLHNGQAAGQAVPHVHMHLLPRFKGDGGGTLHDVVRVEDQRPLEAVHAQLQGRF